MDANARQEIRIICRRHRAATLLPAGLIAGLTFAFNLGQTEAVADAGAGQKADDYRRDLLAALATALQGLAAAHADLLTVNLDPAYVIRADAPVRGKVALVTCDIREAVRGAQVILNPIPYTSLEDAPSTANPVPTQRLS